MTHHITFPHLGLEFTVNTVAFSIGGFLFDQFSQAVYWVLLPSGLALWAVGIGSRHFFKSSSCSLT